jgi:hypothetical protein
MYRHYVNIPKRAIFLKRHELEPGYRFDDE